MTPKTLKELIHDLTQEQYGLIETAFVENAEKYFGCKPAIVPHQVTDTAGQKEAKN